MAHGWKVAAAIAMTAALALLTGSDGDRSVSDEPTRRPDPCWEMPGAAYGCLTRRRG